MRNFEGKIGKEAGPQKVFFSFRLIGWKKANWRVAETEEIKEDGGNGANGKKLAKNG